MRIIKNKLALFDLDGTLFETSNVNYLAYKEACEKFGYLVNYDYFANYCNGRHYKVFLPKIGVDSITTIEKIHKLKKEVYYKYLDAAKINTHLFEIIKLIKLEYYICLVTTASQKNSLEILKHFNVLELFDKIITAEDVSKVKPDPEGFIYAMNYFKVNYNDTIIFEDSDVGIKAAVSSKASVVKISKF